MLISKHFRNYVTNWAVGKSCDFFNLHKSSSKRAQFNECSQDLRHTGCDTHSDIGFQLNSISRQKGVAQRQGEESDQIEGVFNKRFVRICRLATAADERRTAAERRLWENLFKG